MNILINKVKILLQNKTHQIILVGVLVVFAIGFLSYQQFISANVPIEVQEVDLNFDPEGVYAILAPRADGNAMILNLKRTSVYDAVNYELAYNAEGIDRGVMGEIDIKERKGEYTQEILFGTCSRNVCKYDKGVENGTLSLRIKKGNTIYKMTTLWHLQRVDVALGKLISGDNHFSYKMEGKQVELALIGFTIINDLSGAPKLPADKTILGKVYSLSTAAAKDLKPGDVTIELSDKVEDEAKIARFDETKGEWIELETKVDSNKLSAKSPIGGIFTVLINKK